MGLQFGNQLQEFLGPETYLKVLECGYGSKRDVYELRTMLRLWLEQNTKHACECVTWSSHQVIGLGYETRPAILFEQFDVLKERNPWLTLVRCKVCGGYWYIAMDTVDDDYYLSRLSEEQANEVLSQDKWPNIFDKLKNVSP